MQFFLQYALAAVAVLLFGLAGLVVLVVVVIGIPLSLALTGVIGLQLAGVLKKVPFTYNVRNLLVRWRTTAITAAAFTFVVALMTVLLAFVNGMDRLTQNSGIPSNVIVLADGATDELFSNLGYGD